jgi:hypothetical protein
MLATRETVTALLEKGKRLIVAGDESVLSDLPKGEWVGGTIPYFMTAQGGKTSRDRAFVVEVPEFAKGVHIATYDEQSISRVGIESPEHGYTILILPAFTRLHQQFALEAPRYEQQFFKVVAGWIAGTHIDELGTVTPKVFAGPTGEKLDTKGVALHVELPQEYQARIGIINIFEPAEGPAIQFPSTGFEASDCIVEGKRENIVDVLDGMACDWRLPLVSDFCGTRFNVSIQSVDSPGRKLKFFAPVFEGATYHAAKPIANYAHEFVAAIPPNIWDTVFSCNCVLNFQHGQLEGRHTGGLLGPMTFGEIAYQLVNQTLVYMTVSLRP